MRELCPAKYNYSWTFEFLAGNYQILFYLLSILPRQGCTERQASNCTPHTHTTHTKKKKIATWTKQRTTQKQ